MIGRGLDVRHLQGWGRMKMGQVFVKKWEGDQIVYERFYYNIPGQ